MSEDVEAPQHKCPHCGGAGEKVPIQGPCPRCGGTGYEQYAAGHEWRVPKLCKHCGGTSKAAPPDVKCRDCGLATPTDDSKAIYCEASINEVGTRIRRLIDHPRRCAAFVPKAAPEPTPSEAAPAEHKCRYGGIRQYQERWDEQAKKCVEVEIHCGDDGWLCDRCQQDRADARAGVPKLTVLDERLDAHNDRLETLEADMAELRRRLAYHKHPGPMTMAGPGLVDKEGL